MMSETVVTVDGNTNNTNNPRQGPTVKTDPGQSNIIGGININVLYFKTIPGILKLVQLVLGIICMACASPPIGSSHWFMFVVVTSFIATILWTFIYLLSIREALKIPIDWILTELINTAIVTLMYCLAFIIQLSVWSFYESSRYRSSQIVAGVFGLFNTIAYGAGVFFLRVECKSSQNQ